MKRKSSHIEEEEESDSEIDSEEELQDAFAKGLLKPGLNKVIEKTVKKSINQPELLKEALNKLKLDLPWIEKLDVVNAPAPLAPELALQQLEQEERRAKQLKGNKKLAQLKPTEDPVINDFKRETMFHRQAQAAVMFCMPRIKKLGIPTIRPEDYYAEMAKTDEHMHKIRTTLQKKEQAVARSEKVRQLRLQRKVGKQMQVEATLKKHAEKKQMLDEVKKFRKGVRKDLNFLDDKKKPGSSNKSHAERRLSNKQKVKNSKFGFGGKKRGTKMNDRESSADMSGYQRPRKDIKGLKRRDKGGNNKSQRPGKNRRVQMKNKKK
ncbi:GSCOCG00002126001-RA-CDS [Cotesia congregata]|uniref:Similar to CG1542: Probable rRNA-processing protein EBP2 homolog (Drosophila melanogaster) n=1 Tax=Cotesia congregata TaxID=51543 RepID=A0A8J2MSJ2_COTCN|nr:GSCOCG00002126001-RA-CDS [Cotesia congregata]CAG5104124.1 Similar to CG1542: Probable rRNA-processing protein EBP2 homolog (Drosophila melanogaster) [Cotesia congregata]